MKIAIASDHAGFEQKSQLSDYILGLGHEIIDFGPYCDEKVDYPDYALKVADAIASGQVDRGVLICGTGIGMAVAANKVSGVRAANVIDPKFAKLAREHNDANVIALSGRYVDLDVNEKCVSVFLDTEFEGGRHEERLAKIRALEG